MLKVAFTAGAFMASTVISNAHACELKVVGAAQFNKTCKIVVGFADGKKVGPFRASGTKVGTCPGFLPFSSVKGDTVVVKGKTFKLSEDCRSAS